MEAGEIVIKTEIDNDELEKGLTETEKKTQEAQKRIEEAQERTNKAKEETARLNKEIKEYEEEINRIQQNNEYLKENMRNTNEIKNKIDNIKNSLKDTVKSVVRWGLAIFGIRGAFNFIRSSMSIISQQDKQLGADIEYMRNAIAYTLEPVIRGIVNLMKQLLFYVQYIIKVWTGKNIFENANKSLQGANKQAKALNKQLAGFDEMNILSDNSSSGGGTTGPSFDLTAPENIEPPAWVVWIAENKDIVIAGLLGIAAGLLAVQLGLTGLFGGVIVALIVTLVALIIQNWDKIKEVLLEVWSWIDENVIQPVVSLFIWLWDKIVEIFGPFISFFTSIFSAIWGTISNILGTIWTNIKTMIDNVVQIVRGLWEIIKNIILPIYAWIYNNLLKPFINGFKDMINIVWSLVKKVATTVGDVIAGAFKGVINGILLAIETILNSPINSINKLIDVINAVPGIDLKKLKTFKFPRLAKGGIVSMPGHGVPIGNAIVGERGQEAVLPLTDSQQMALLGEAIGRYININANIPIYVGNRQIAREMRKINAEDDFAFNR